MGRWRRLRRPPQRLRRSVGAADQWEQREHQRKQQSREQQSRETSLETGDAGLLLLGCGGGGGGGGCEREKQRQQGGRGRDGRVYYRQRQRQRQRQPPPRRLNDNDNDNNNHRLYHDTQHAGRKAGAQVRGEGTCGRRRFLTSRSRAQLLTRFLKNTLFGEKKSTG